MPMWGTNSAAVCELSDFCEILSLRCLVGATGASPSLGRGSIAVSEGWNTGGEVWTPAHNPPFLAMRIPRNQMAIVNFVCRRKGAVQLSSSLAAREAGRCYLIVRLPHLFNPSKASNHFTRPPRSGLVLSRKRVRLAGDAKTRGGSICRPIPQSASLHHLDNSNAAYFALQHRNSKTFLSSSFEFQSYISQKKQ
jgi:hypothetical protein